MNLNEITKRFECLRISEKRLNNEGYCELIVYTEDKEKWTNILNEIFGPPMKAEGIDPSKHDCQLTAHCGGIRKNQISFMREVDDSIIVAVLWPWNNGICTTLKISKIKKN